MASRQGLPVFGRHATSLEKGSWQAGVAFRAFTSDKHYQGTEPFPELDPGGPTNRQRQIDLGVTYGLSSRTSLSLNVPLHSNSFTLFRVPPGGTTAVAGPTESRGIGDISVRARRWMVEPARAGRGNVAVTLGVKVPTGKADVEDTIYGVTVPVDWSIQLGDRGWGILTGVDGYFTHGRASLFAAASYLFNPRDTTGTPSFFTALQGRPPVSSSSTDQFSLQLGAGMSIKDGWPEPTLSYRIEGVPVDDVIGDSNGMRRPGTIQFVEPGLAFARGHHRFSVSVPLMVRVNIKDSPFSVRVEDATVPDRMVVFGYGVRF